MKITKSNVSPMKVLAAKYVEKVETISTLDVVVNEALEVVTVITYNTDAEHQNVLHTDYKTYNYEEFIKMAMSQDKI